MKITIKKMFLDNVMFNWIESDAYYLFESVDIVQSLYDELYSYVNCCEREGIEFSDNIDNYSKEEILYIAKEIANYFEINF